MLFATPSDNQYRQSLVPKHGLLIKTTTGATFVVMIQGSSCLNAGPKDLSLNYFNISRDAARYPRVLLRAAGGGKRAAAFYQM